MLNMAAKAVHLIAAVERNMGIGRQVLWEWAGCCLNSNKKYNLERDSVMRMMGVYYNMRCCFTGISS